MPRLNTIGKQYLDSNGDPLGGGKLYFYDSGTTTPATTYSDEAETTANANPVVLDAAGRQPDVFYTGSLKIVLTDEDDVVVEERDPVTIPESTLQKFTTVAGTTYTVSSSDVGKWLRFTSGSSVTVTWPDSLSLPAGAKIDFWRQGSGSVRVEAETAADTEFNGDDGFTLGAQYSHVEVTVVSDSVMDCLPTGTVTFSSP